MSVRAAGAIAPSEPSSGDGGQATSAPTAGFAIPDSCSNIWHIIPSPNEGPSYNELQDIAIFNSSNIWAVGHFSNAGTHNTLVERWNGTSWSVVPSPNVGSGNNELLGVTAVSTTDIWAVGFETEANNVKRNIAQHWNGSTWTTVFTPGSPTYYNVLYDVAAVSSNDVYAVGYAMDTNHIDHTLVLHWNGLVWAAMNTPNNGASVNDLYGVAVVSSTDIWAVGTYVVAGSGGVNKTLAIHWNGNTWSLSTTPNPSNDNNYLESIDASSGTNVWAVGYYESNAIHKTLAMHWNGANWVYTTSPNSGADNNELYDVSMASGSDAWAVGGFDGATQGQTLTEHWNGANWTIVPSPNVGTGTNDLYGVAAVWSSSEAWAVGDFLSGNLDLTLTEQYSTVCTPTPTVTRTATPGGPTATMTPTPTSCPLQFSDVPQGSTFYDYVRCLACRSIISGYSDGTFKPNNDVTRGQLAKIISNAAAYDDAIAPGHQSFADVPTSNTFWVYVERVLLHNVISGYEGDGSTTNPCTGQVEQSGEHYFRPCINATRGQIAKIDSVARGYTDLIPPNQETFADVPSSNTFWIYVERVASHSVISGYQGNGSTHNPCTGQVEQSDALYFRPCNNATRGQIAKIVANTFYPGCQTPSRNEK